jgi:hypothetical protein
MGWACSINVKTSVCRDKGGISKGKKHLENTEIDGTILIKWIFKKQGRMD